jgi:hypothetical protein
MDYTDLVRWRSHSGNDDGPADACLVPLFRRSYCRGVPDTYRVYNGDLQYDPWIERIDRVVG